MPLSLLRPYFSPRHCRIAALGTHSRGARITLAHGGVARRRAASAVEFAVVAPLLFMLVLGMIEFGRMLMVQQIVTNAAREGARKAILPGATETLVSYTVETYLNNSGIKSHTFSVSPSPAAASPASPIMVTVRVPYEKVTWLPIGTVTWLKDKAITASVEMRKEDF